MIDALTLALSAMIAAGHDPRPPLEDVRRLPESADVDAGWRLACDCRAGLAKMLDVLPQGSAPYREAEAAYLEAGLLLRWHELASLARAENMPAECVRDYLAQLRDLDPRTYYSGEWPPPVPYWRLPRHP